MGFRWVDALKTLFYNTQFFELRKVVNTEVGDISAKILKELDCETVFKIGAVEIKESVVVTWIIMAFVLFLCIILVRNLKVENPGKKQLVLETCVTGLKNIIGDMLGENASRYTDYICSVVIYIGIANIMGIFGYKPPTKDINVTTALAIMSIFMIEYAGIRQKGALGWAKSFAEPIAVVLPINLLEIIIRPLSLCMRLFGNVLGSFVIMKLIEEVIPIGLPIVCSLYFDIFDGFIQAYVFVFLTSLFIKEAVE